MSKAMPNYWVPLLRPKHVHFDRTTAPCGVIHIVRTNEPRTRYSPLVILFEHMYFLFFLKSLCNKLHSQMHQFRQANLCDITGRTSSLIISFTGHAGVRQVRWYYLRPRSGDGAGKLWAVKSIAGQGKNLVNSEVPILCQKDFFLNTRVAGNGINIPLFASHAHPKSIVHI